jgi:flagellin
MYINTNIGSLNAQYNLGQSQNSLQTALQRLSSGLRVNSAQDDAAGFAIANRMGAQVASVNQAVRNANDGISLAQTANSGMNTISNDLQTLRQLAVQSANASNSSLDRQSIQTQVNQILADINTVATSTQFNGVSLLDGTFTAQNFQVGANQGQTITVANLGNAKTSAIGSSSAADVGAVGNSNALSSADLIVNGVSIGGSSASSDGLSFTSNASSGIAKAAAINAVSAQTGVTATANATVATADLGTGNAMSQIANASADNITINGVQIAISVGSNATTSANRQSVVAAINSYSSLTGVVASDTGNDNTGVTLTATDGRNIHLVSTLGNNATGLGTGTKDYYGGYTLSSTQTITVASGAGTLSQSGLVAGSYSAQTAAATTANSTTNANLTSINAGDFTINGVSIGASSGFDNASTAAAGESALAKAGAINAVSAKTGVMATASNVVTGAAMTAANTVSGTITINNVAINVSVGATSTALNRQSVVSAINAVQGRTGVVAVDTGSDASGVQLVAADGRNVDLSYTTVAQADIGLATTATTYAGSVALSSTSTITIGSGSTVNSIYNSLGLNAGTYGAGRTGQALSTIDLTSAKSASSALTAIDNSINAINGFSATLGAIQNRFSSTVSNLQVYSNNLQSARSRITDADFAAETAALSRAQVLQQAGTAMLAQANALPQQVLTLLK